MQRKFFFSPIFSYYPTTTGACWLFLAPQLTRLATRSIAAVISQAKKLDSRRVEGEGART